MTNSYTELHQLIARLPAILRAGYDLPIKSLEMDVLAPVLKTSSPPAVTVKPAHLKPLDLHLKEGSVADKMEQLSVSIRSCTKCDLCKGRNKAINGTGSMHPLVVVVGEVPGSDEDRLGLPFVGAAGQFLDKWLEAIGLSRYTNAFITSLVRCMPPENRSPTALEIASCAPYLATQIQLLKPVAILTVGSEASACLYGAPVKMSDIRGKFFDYQGIPWMPIYHPGTVLREPELKRPVWEDLKNFKQTFLTRPDAGS